MANWEDLEQEEIWLGKPLSSLEDDHLVNLKAWLLRHSGQFQDQMIFAMNRFTSTLGGEMAQDAMDSEIADTLGHHHLLWMEERPFFKALNREINKRQGIHVCRVIERT